MLNTEQIQRCIIWACEQEVAAPKPGNVNCFSAGHNMEIDDFIKSAHAIAPALTNKNTSVGQRILSAIQATRQVVDCNTNLGIVLLFAPLCVAIEQCQNFEQLPKQLSLILKNLSIEDAIACYQAIQLADAGGLGNVDEQDVTNVPTVTLLQAMDAAKDRDSIALQYTNNYQQIFHTGLDALNTKINYGENVEWATAFAYLSLLSNIPDTLICRKQGAEYALKVMEQAKSMLEKASGTKSLEAILTELVDWDNKLKMDAINPGTTADMTATALLLHAFQQAFPSNRISV